MQLCKCKPSQERPLFHHTWLSTNFRTLTNTITRIILILSKLRSCKLFSSYPFFRLFYQYIRTLKTYQRPTPQHTLRLASIPTPTTPSLYSKFSHKLTKKIPYSKSLPNYFFQTARLCIIL
jgi:hypothetical protein